MKVSVKFFGGLRFDMGFQEIVVHLEEDSTIEQVVSRLIEMYPQAKTALYTQNIKSFKFMVVINGQSIANPSHAIVKDGDIIYFMGPIAGG